MNYIIRLFVVLSILFPQIELAHATLICNKNIKSLKRGGINVTFLNKQSDQNSTAQKTAYADKRKFLSTIEVLNKKPKLSDSSDQQTIPTYHVNIKPFKELKSFHELKVSELIAPEGKTIMLWDIDRTLLHLKYIIHNLNQDKQQKAFDDFRKTKIFKGTDKDYKEFCDFVRSYSRVSADEYALKESLLENYVKTIIKETQKQGVIHIGLTARDSRIAQGTYDQLKKLEIDFAELSKLGNYSDPKIGLYNGIFYTNNPYNTERKAKVDFIPDIVKVLKEKLGLTGPFSFSHSDDDGDEVEGFAKAKLELPNHVTIQPYWYTYWDTYHAPFINSIYANPQQLLDDLKDDNPQQQLLDEFKKQLLDELKTVFYPMFLKHKADYTEAESDCLLSATLEVLIY